MKKGDVVRVLGMGEVAFVVEQDSWDGQYEAFMHPVGHPTASRQVRVDDVLPLQRGAHCPHCGLIRCPHVAGITDVHDLVNIAEKAALLVLAIEKEELIEKAIGVTEEYREMIPMHGLAAQLRPLLERQGHLTHR